MLKLLKNLKGTWVSVLVIILLLCVQAWTDLTLPDYTSKIVNIGIQSGGIEYVTPQVIRKSQMDNLLIFTTNDDEILSNYTLLSKNNLKDNNIRKKYPEIENQDLYELKKMNKKQKERLDEIISKPLLISYFIQNKDIKNKVRTQILENVPQEQSNIIKDCNTIELMNYIPVKQKEKLLDRINKELDDRFGLMVSQIAIKATRNEYLNVGINLDKVQNNYIIVTGLKMLGIALLSTVSAITVIFLSARVAGYLAKILRDKIFKKVLQFAKEEFTKFSTASLITRTTNDIQQIQMLIAILFRVVVYAPIIGLGGFFHVLNNSNNSMTWIIGFALLCITTVVLILFAVTMPKFRKLQELIDKLNLVSREILTGLPVIRAFNTEKREEQRAESANRELMKTSMFVNRAMSIMMPSLMFIMNGVMLLIIWVGGHKVDVGIIQVGDMIAFIQYTMQIVISFLMISAVSIMLPRAAVSARRINEVLDTEPSIKDRVETKEFLENKKGYIEFKNVSFRYPGADKEILEDISFVAKPGETTAIIGSTGSGKSTIVNLIPRFYDVTGGELVIDGVNVKDVPQKELRKKIGFVPQKGILFSGTIESNIKYGNNDISDEEMKKAAKIAQATNFIARKKEGFGSEIAQGGTNVSGGQKQRLSIARALAINPEIIVFDDSFSALDFKTDKNLREELARKTDDKTVIIVTQRISTILNANQIIVLEKGKIVGKGTHTELMKQCKEYKEIAISQLTEEELK